MEKVEEKIEETSIQEKDEDVFALSEAKVAAIPLLPVKEVFLPYANKTVKFRKPITRDVKAVANIPNQELKTYQMISNLTGMTPDDVEKLEYRDFRILNSVLESFL